VGPSLIAADLDELILNNPEYGEALIARTGLQKSLTKIVSIVVDHQICKVRLNLSQKEGYDRV
jgi:hypothetical protein